MNPYSELLYFLKGLAEANQFVNTVTKGAVDKLDLEKANIYPLVHITIEEATFTNGSTIIFDVSLECLNGRDINKEVVTDDKFWSNDNEVDNHNVTMAILNDIWLRIKRDWDERNITTTDNATLQKIEFAKGNILDGWSLNFQVELPNTTITLCQ
jgi:hypothetical protein